MNETLHKKSLASEYPLIASEWNVNRNQGLRPDSIAPHSNRSVWWVCPMGHEYEMVVNKRTSRSYGCPYCSGKRVLSGFNDLKSMNPSLAAEWDYEKNDSLRPDRVSLHSNKYAWWRCSVCNHSWRTKINDRANGRGCPACASEKRIKSFRENTYLKRGVNDLRVLRPDLLEEWDYAKNSANDTFPEDFTTHSKEKVWWKCAACGNGWQATIKNRVDNNSGCPTCMKYNRTSFPEQAIVFYLSMIYSCVENGYTKIFGSTNRELDIYIPAIRTGIEYDGKVWHSNKRAQKTDAQKYEVCRQNGIRLIRVSEREQFALVPNCDDFIWREDLTDKGLDQVIRRIIALISKQEISVDVEMDRGNIMKQYITVIKNKSIQVKYPVACKEWDWQKNKGITPEMINASSNVKYWWRCELGHSYKATPGNKLGKRQGCPICSGRQVQSGFNDLATRYPEVAKTWDDELNFPVKVSEVMPGSQRKYWWRCELGHAYKTTPNNRTAGNSNCPICAGKQILVGFNDLCTTNPDIVNIWDYEKNEGAPDMYSSGSGKKVWWKCKNGHSWQKTISSQITYNFCLVCECRLLVTGQNDLAVTHSELVKEWDYQKNGELTPQNVMHRSDKKVWWKCSECGYEWQAQISMRAHVKTGCPKCGYSKKMQATRTNNVISNNKDLISLFPEIAKEWDYERNDGLDPAKITPASNRKVWWICQNGHHYQAWMSDRTGKHKTGCPYCARKRKLDEKQG